jgi:hypothetical protein
LLFIPESSGSSPLSKESKNSSKKKWRASDSQATREYRQRESLRVAAYKQRKKLELLERRRAADNRKHVQETSWYRNPAPAVLSVVSLQDLKRDTTRWSGPGASRTERLAAAATAWLRAAEEKKKRELLVGNTASGEGFGKTGTETESPRPCGNRDAAAPQGPGRRPVVSRANRQAERPA